MICDRINIGGRTDLHIIRNDDLIARRYTNGIVWPHAVLSAVEIGNSFVLTHVDARPSILKNMLEMERARMTEIRADMSLKNLDDPLQPNSVDCPGFKYFTSWRMEHNFP